MDVGAWLHGLGLGRYERAFRDNDVDAGLLPTLDADDLPELGIASLGHRKRLLAVIAALTGQPVPTPAPAAPQAERRQLTVMFVDLVGSTALSSKLNPEEMRELLGTYQNAVAGEVVRFEGHVAKFMGDGVLGYFGYPRAHEDEAERAVRAGLAIVDAVGRLAAPGGLPLAARVGIATGLVVVGDLIGEGSSREEAVAGETPNLAARLQGWAEPGQVVVSEATRQLLAGLFEVEVLGVQAFKGIDTAVPVFRVARERSGLGRFEARQAVALAPLVGREEELALLLDRWELAKAGEGQLILLAGEPGIGMSRLVQALREGLTADRHARLLYQCSPHHANSALWPAIQQLGFAAGFAHGDDDAARLTKLEALLRLAVTDAGEAVPLLATLLSLSPGDRYPPVPMDAQQKKQRTLRALVDQLAGLAARQPVLLVVEDAHWIDPTTVELLDLAADRLQKLPVLLAITFRPEFVPPWAGRPHATLLSLGRLGSEEGAAMVRRVTGGKVLPAGILDQILAKTDGVPLFLEELTKTVLESGLLREVAKSA